MFKNHYVYILIANQDVARHIKAKNKFMTF